jgi:hypothetical protein
MATIRVAVAATPTSIASVIRLVITSSHPTAATPMKATSTALNTSQS